MTPTSRRARPLILLAEDDPVDRKLYGTALWYNGFDVLTAETGEAALSLTLEREPDLVLLDLLLPEMTGLEVCRRIREAGSKVPVVALTGRAEEQFGDQARAVGFDAYLEKPLDPLQVLHSVEELIGRAPPAGEGDAPPPTTPPQPS